MNLEIRVWDVGHGLSVWIRTPSNQNHWIDAGYNPDGDFSPSIHVAKNYPGAKPIHHLCISHPDKDHFDDLDRLVRHLGIPRVFLRNKSVPDEIKFGSRQFEYQKIFEQLNASHNHPVDWNESPLNSLVNGGVSIAHNYLDWRVAGNTNDSSIVMAYQYLDTVALFPGDIEEAGWSELRTKYLPSLRPLLSASKFRILVAPHHGRGSGFSQTMFEDFEPHVAIISDEYGREPTDNRFRTRPIGINFGGSILKFVSTKTNGRAKVVIGVNGLQTIRGD